MWGVKAHGSEESYWRDRKRNHLVALVFFGVLAAGLLIFFGQIVHPPLSVLDLLERLKSNLRTMFR